MADGVGIDELTKLERLRVLLLDNLIELFESGKATAADRNVARAITSSTKDVCGPEEPEPRIQPGAATSTIPFPTKNEVAQEASA